MKNLSDKIRAIMAESIKICWNFRNFLKTSAEVDPAPSPNSVLTYEAKAVSHSEIKMLCLHSCRWNVKPTGFNESELIFISFQLNILQ